MKNAVYCGEKCHNLNFEDLFIRVPTKFVILIRTYEIRDEIMRFRFRTKVSDLRDVKNENRFISF